MTRLGLIGAGRWAEMHLHALRRIGTNVDRVLVASEASAERVQRDWGVPSYLALGAFLDGPLDAVIIASPNHLHAEQAIAALQSGLHVLVEKPMALNLPDAERMLDEARRADRVLAVGHEIRTFAWAEAVAKLLHDGTLGTPRHLALSLWRRPYRAGASGWKTDPAKLGSSILEEPIHYLDLARWWLGEPHAVQAFATSRAGHEGRFENLDVRLWTDGAQASVTRSIAAWGHRVEVMLVGDDGSFRTCWSGAMDADPSPRVEAWMRLDDNGAEDRDAPPVPLELRAETGHAHDLPRQARAFLDAIQGSGAPVADGRDGLEAVRLCLAVERSLREGERRVELGD